MRLSVSLLLIFVHAISAVALLAGSVLSYAVIQGSAYGVDFRSLGASLVFVGFAGFLLFAAVLLGWALRRGGLRDTAKRAG